MLGRGGVSVPPGKGHRVRAASTVLGDQLPGRLCSTASLDTAPLCPPHRADAVQPPSCPRMQQRAVLGPVPLTQTSRTQALRDQEDEIFKL